MRHATRHLRAIVRPHIPHHRLTDCPECQAIATALRLREVYSRERGKHHWAEELEAELDEALAGPWVGAGD